MARRNRQKEGAKRIVEREERKYEKWNPEGQRILIQETNFGHLVFESTDNLEMLVACFSDIVSMFLKMSETQ